MAAGRYGEGGRRPHLSRYYGEVIYPGKFSKPHGRQTGMTGHTINR